MRPHSDSSEADAAEAAVKAARRRRFYIDLHAAETRYGRAPSLTQAEMSLILEEGIPAWLVIGARFSNLSARCEKGIACLLRLKKDLER